MLLEYSFDTYLVADNCNYVITDREPLTPTFYASANQWAGIMQLAPPPENSRRHVCILTVDLINLHPPYTYKVLCTLCQSLHELQVWVY